MIIDTSKYQTADGFQYRVLATDLPGEFPVAIHVNGEIAQLRHDLSCPDNEGYSLVERQSTCTRFLNMYRAADGGFCPGSKTYKTDEERLNMRDTERALFGVEITFNENTGEITARRV